MNIPIENEKNIKQKVNETSIEKEKVIKEYDYEKIKAIMKKEIEIAKEIINNQKAYIITSYPYFLHGLTKLRLEATYYINTMATDGVKLYYNPEFVIDLYKKDPSTINGVILHELFHCLFNHIPRAKDRNTFLWNIATDIAINHIIEDISQKEEQKYDSKIFKNTQFKRVSLPKGLGLAHEVYDKDKKYKGKDADFIYVKVLEEYKNNPNKFKQLQNPLDDHDIWDNEMSYDGDSQDSNMENKEGIENGNSSGAGSNKKTGSSKKEDNNQNNNGNSNNGNRNNSNDNKNKDKDKNKNGSKGPGKDNKNNKDKSLSDIKREIERELKAGKNKYQKPKIDKEKLKEEWNNVANKTKTDMDIRKSKSKEYGSISSDLEQLLEIECKTLIDWKDYLKSFSKTFVDVKLDMNEYDPVFISSFNMYVPNTTTTRKKISNIAIALDTSGSVFCNDNTLKKILNEAFSIIKGNDTKNNRISIHVIMADADVKNDILIENTKDVDKVIENLQIVGGGGTDFRPVFEYIEDKINSGEYNNFKGLIYFTDGYGAFPTSKPSFKTMWVLTEKDAKVPFGEYTYLDETQYLEVKNKYYDKEFSI